MLDRKAAKVMGNNVHKLRSVSVLAGVAWEGVGLLLLGRTAWARGIRLVIRWGQQMVVDVRRLGNFGNGTWCDRRLGSSGVRESSGADWRDGCRGLGDEREGLDNFIFHEASNVPSSVFRIQNIFDLLLITTPYPKEHRKRDDSDTTYTAHNTTDDGTNN